MVRVNLFNAKKVKDYSNFELTVGDVFLGYDRLFIFTRIEREDKSSKVNAVYELIDLASGEGTGRNILSSELENYPDLFVHENNLWMWHEAVLNLLMSDVLKPVRELNVDVQLDERYHKLK